MRKSIVILAVAILAAVFCGPAAAEDSATTNDVYELILKAVPVIQELGDEGLDAFKDPKGEFVYKNAYVIVFDCANMKMAAHPNPKLVGIDLTDHQDKNPDPAKRKYQDREVCEVSQRPNGGWVEYYWNKPNSEEVARKVGFTIRVPGTGYAVLSTIYDDTSNVDELNATLK